MDFREKIDLIRSANSNETDLIMKFLKDKNPILREEAASKLMEVKNISIIQDLLKAIESDDPNYRNAAIQSLTLMGERAIPYLISELDNKDKDVRKFILDALGNIGSDKAVPYIIKKIDDEDENVMQGACESLGNIASPKAVLALLEALKKNEWIQFSAIEALGKIGDNKAVLPLLDILKGGSEWIKFVVIEALGKLKDERALFLILNEIFSENEEIEKLAVLSSYKIMVSSSVIKTENCEIEEKRKTELRLKSLFFKVEEKELKIAIINLLGKFKMIESMELFLSSLINPDQDISEEALKSIILLSKNGIPFLLSMLKEEDISFEYELGILYTLGEIAQGENDVFEILKDYINREEEEIREISVESIAKINFDKAEKYIIEALNDDSGNVRRTSIEMLSYFKSNISIDEALLKLEDMYDDVRNAAKGLILSLEAENKKEKILDELKKDLEKKVVFEKEKILLELVGELKIKDAVPLIIEIVKNHKELKKTAILALGNIKSKLGLSFLIEKLKSKDVVIRKVAADALGKMEDETVIDELIKSLGDKDPWVRFFISNSLNNFKSERIFNKFTEMLSTEKEAPVIIEILNSLSKYDLKELEYEKIKTFILDNDDDIVTAAIRSIKELAKSKKEIRDFLIKFLEKKSWKIKNSILEILKESNVDNKDLIYILPLLNDNNTLIKDSALEIVGRIGDISLIKPMISTMMEDNLEEITRKLLMEVKEKGFDKIIEGLNSEYDAVRVFTANALTIVGDNRASEALLKALEDENWKVRYFAAEALGNMKIKEATESLLRLLEDENKYVSDSALEAIRKIGGRK